MTEGTMEPAGKEGMRYINKISILYRRLYCERFGAQITGNEASGDRVFPSNLDYCRMTTLMFMVNIAFTERVGNPNRYSWIVRDHCTSIITTS